LGGVTDEIDGDDSDDCNGVEASIIDFERREGLYNLGLNEISIDETRWMDSTLP